MQLYKHFKVKLLSHKVTEYPECMRLYSKYTLGCKMFDFAPDPHCKNPLFTLSLLCFSIALGSQCLCGENNSLNFRSPFCQTLK